MGDKKFQSLQQFSDVEIELEIRRRHSLLRKMRCTFCTQKYPNCKCILGKQPGAYQNWPKEEKNEQS